MMLSEMRGLFLYQTRPDLFPEGWLTNEEMELWSRYYDWKKSAVG